MLHYIGSRLIQVLITRSVSDGGVLPPMRNPAILPTEFLGNPNIPPEARVQLRAQLGLDKPLPEQWLTYLKNWTGDLGVSWTRYPRPASTIIRETMPRTLVRFLSSTVVSFGVSSSCGVC